MIRKQVHIKSAQDKALKRLARRTHRQDLFPEAGVGGGKTSMSVHPGKAAKAPIDTNVLAYAYDRSEPVKQKQKLNVLGELPALRRSAVTRLFSLVPFVQACRFMEGIFEASRDGLLNIERVTPERFSRTWRCGSVTATRPAHRSPI